MPTTSNRTTTVERRTPSRPLARWSALIFALSCSASTQKPAVDAAMEDPKLRHEALEATLRVTDENPEYVDELFALTLKHPKTLDRFLQNTARDLVREDLSRATTRRLAEQPRSLRQTIIATLDAISDQPESLDALSQALHERPQVAAMAVVQRDETVRVMLRALMREVLKNDRARAAFLVAVQENSTEMAQIIAPNPATLASLVKGFGKVGVKAGKAELEALVDAVSQKDD